MIHMLKDSAYTHTHTKYNTWHVCYILAIKEIIEEKHNLLLVLFSSVLITLFGTICCLRNQRNYNCSAGFLMEHGN